MADLFNDLNFQNNPWFNMGAGILAESRRGVPTSTAIGQGILTGMENLRRQQTNLQQADAQRSAASFREFQMEQAKVEAERLARQAQARQALTAANPALGTMLEAYPGAATSILSSRMAPQKKALQPFYATDDQGNLRAFQLTPSGAPEEIALPAGVTPTKPVQWRDIGGQDVGYGYGQTTPRAVVSKTLPPEAEPETRAAQREQTLRAQQRVEAQAELPSVEDQFSRTNAYIEELIDHPGLESGTGLSATLPVFPGSSRADFEARRDQLVGGAFLQAYQELKGGGQITEIEGQKAEQSLARLSQRLSKEDFVQALRDFQSVIKAGRERARKKAGAPKEPKVVDWSDLP